jgi:hypothetical protein
MAGLDFGFLAPEPVPAAAPEQPERIITQAFSPPIGTSVILPDQETDHRL